MKKQNVIDLAAYREAQDHESEAVMAAIETAPDSMSEELKSAIQTLIERLRSQDQQR